VFGKIVWIRWLEVCLVSSYLPWNSCSLKPDLFLQTVDPIVHKYISLLKGNFFLKALLVLLLQKVHFVNICVLCFAEVIFEISDITAYLFEKLIQEFCLLMFQGCALTSENLRLSLIVLKILVQHHSIVLFLTWDLIDLTIKLPTLWEMGMFDALKLVPAEVTRWVLA
jgi:hypothetical protein